jgi:hypothetical protein
VVKIAMLSVLGFNDASHHCWKQKMWSKKKMGLRRCTNVVRIAMPSFLGFDDGGHHCWKEQTWSKKRVWRWCTNVIDYAQHITECCLVDWTLQKKINLMIVDGLVVLRFAIVLTSFSFLGP